MSYKMKRLIIITCLVALSMASPSLQTQAGKLCSGGTGAFTVTSFDVNPWPLVKNSAAVGNMTGTFSSAQTITGFYLNALVNGVLPFNDVVPASGTYAAGQRASFIQKSFVPSISPSGSYVVKVGLVNSQNQHLNCWELDFKF